MGQPTPPVARFHKVPLPPPPPPSHPPPAQPANTHPPSSARTQPQSAPPRTKHSIQQSPPLTPINRNTRSRQPNRRARDHVARPVRVRPNPRERHQPYQRPRQPRKFRVRTREEHRQRRSSRRMARRHRRKVIPRLKARLQNSLAPTAHRISRQRTKKNIRLPILRPRPRDQQLQHMRHSTREQPRNSKIRRTTPTLRIQHQHHQPRNHHAHQPPELLPRQRFRLTSPQAGSTPAPPRSPSRTRPIPNASSTPTTIGTAHTAAADRQNPRPDRPKRVQRRIDRRAHRIGPHSPRL